MIRGRDHERVDVGIVQRSPKVRHAGRCAILHLLPFSLNELEDRRPIKLSSIGRSLPRRGFEGDADVMETLFRGFYPRIHDKGLDPQRWLRDYYQTYVERDVREIVNVGDIETFGRANARRTRVVLPDWRGPVRVTTGYSRAVWCRIDSSVRLIMFLQYEY